MTTTEMLDRFFSPRIVLRERNGIFSPDIVEDIPFFRMFREEAKITGSVNTKNIDAFGLAAGAHGYSIEYKL